MLNAAYTTYKKMSRLIEFQFRGVVVSEYHDTQLWEQTVRLVSTMGFVAKCVFLSLSTVGSTPREKGVFTETGKAKSISFGRPLQILIPMHYTMGILD